MAFLTMFLFFRNIYLFSKKKLLGSLLSAKYSCLDIVEGQGHRLVKVIEH